MHPASITTNCQPFGSVGIVLVCLLGGCRFEPWSDHGPGQGLKKVQSVNTGRHGQVDFLAWKVTFKAHLWNEQRLSQAILQRNHTLHVRQAKCESCLPKWHAEIQGFFEPLHSLITVPNSSSAGKAPFVASKTKNMHQRRTFQGGRGAVERGTWPCPCNLGAKFSETSFPNFKTYFTQIGHCHLKTTF